MELSKKDRLILINQYKILTILNPDESARYANYIRTLELGFELNYDIMASWLTDGMKEEECAEVVDILEMYACLNESYHKLKDKKGINRDHLDFPGFDANEEEKELGYVEYLLYTLNNFKEFKKRGRYPDHDSKAPMLKRYRAMLRVWESLSNRKILAKEEILQILSGEERIPKFDITRFDAAKQEAARVEAAKFEAAKLEAARLEAARDEAARDEADKLEAAIYEAERLEAARIEAPNLAKDETAAVKEKQD